MFTHYKCWSYPIQIQMNNRLEYVGYLSFHNIRSAWLFKESNSRIHFSLSQSKPQSLLYILVLPIWKAFLTVTTRCSSQISATSLPNSCTLQTENLHFITCSTVNPKRAADIRIFKCRALVTLHLTAKTLQNLPSSTTKWLHFPDFCLPFTVRIAKFRRFVSGQQHFEVKIL